MPIISGEELHIWRRDQLQINPGAAAGLDWLLEMEGKVPWRALQASRLHPEQPLTIAQPLLQLANLWCQHIQQQKPLQYLVGRCPWRDMELQVDETVLIPRQETELLVELALCVASELGEPGLTPWADLGCGSGCIAIALARAWPQSQGWAVDISASALKLASLNARIHGVAKSINWLQGNWAEPLQFQAGKWQLLISNPPYIPSAVVNQLEPLVRNNEPRLALDGGDDGLDSIKSICALAPMLLAPGGWLMLEHHHDQSEAVLELLRHAELELIEAKSDLEGTLRFAIARAPGRN
ncbi:peptide chain release factor N(5)-glutamine methyltransferase [Synechococcus sp. UW140]|uniref:peptide chain release factor N(5)-glutamine methyltransferase n=1 Tax=Synechococcus sp. UW140 TaxID=368503 RepID=UPI0025F73BA7|nr:peptide chain release factor N(5)-glutamine methyltransferase [Synechococcus sp. UW140]